MKCAILNIGHELLNGQTVNTNASWMGDRLTARGIQVFKTLVVGDSPEEIVYGIEEASKDVDLILTTGGLGPTSDDITKKTISDHFGYKLVFHQDLFDVLVERFAKRGQAVIERNRFLAYQPEEAELIPNLKGTAQGLWIENKGKVFVAMPGVPHEMKSMIDNYVLDRISNQYQLPKIRQHVMLTAGLGETTIAEMIGDIEKKLPEDISLAYLPSLGIVKLRLTTMDSDDSSRQFDDIVKEVEDRLGNHIFGYAGDTLALKIGELLAEKNLQLATAESCTGGYIAHLITSNPGSSKYYKGSVIAYSYDLKNKILNVSNDTLLEYGAVSKETVEEMANGLIELYNVDYAVSASGIAGPGGGMPGKPVGTVWICVASKKKCIPKKFVFPLTRMENIELTANYSLNMLRQLILEEAE